MRHRPCGTLLLALLFSTVAAVTATQSLAQQNDADHLTCYKVKDPLKLKATADVDTLRQGLSAGCTISKAKMYCVPSGAQNVDDGSGVSVSSSGPRSSSERICYKVKCPEPYPGSTEISDAFGTRTLEKFKTSMLCAPASQGASVLQSGFEHRARGLAQLSEGTDPLSPSVHVSSTDGAATGGSALTKSSTSEPGGGGVVVVLQGASSYGVSLRSDANSRASIRSASLAAGAVLNIHGESVEESNSIAELRSVDVGSSGVSSTAYFPNLARQQQPPVRTGVITCQGQQVASVTEALANDPDWSFFSQVWPDRYETASAATQDEARFFWDNGCVELRVADGGGTIVVNGDLLLISAPNGDNPRQLKRVEITAAGGLSGFAIKDEAAQ